jgi:hypothetical protein
MDHGITRRRLLALLGAGAAGVAGAVRQGAGRCNVSFTVHPLADRYIVSENGVRLAETATVHHAERVAELASAVNPTQSGVYAVLAAGRYLRVRVIPHVAG